MIVFYITLLHLFITGCSKNIDICNQQINDKNTSKKIDYENKLKQFFNTCVLNKNNGKDVVVDLAGIQATGFSAVPGPARGAAADGSFTHRIEDPIAAAPRNDVQAYRSGFLFRQTTANNDKTLILTEES